MPDLYVECRGQLMWFCSGNEHGCSLIVQGCDVSELKGSPCSEVTLIWGRFLEKWVSTQKSEFPWVSLQPCWAVLVDWEREVLTGARGTPEGQKLFGGWLGPAPLLRVCQVAQKLWVPSCLSPQRLNIHVDFSGIVLGEYQHFWALSVLHWILHQEVPQPVPVRERGWDYLLQVHRCRWYGIDAFTLQSAVSSQAAFSVDCVHIPLCAVNVALLINFECFGFESFGKSKFWGN